MKTCPTCHQKIRPLNPHRMDFSKVTLLEQIGRLNRKHKWVKVQRDHNLIKNEEREFTIQCDDVHALRLTWFGLAERKEKRSGFYRITADGINFLKGTFRVPAEILCKDGEVIKRSAKMVTVYQIRKVVLDKEYWDNYPQIQSPIDDDDGDGQEELFR
jgi:hypothetical protein